MESLSDVDKNILKAAEREFSLNGFHDTLVRDIASRADVGKGTVYRHFGNKKELFGSLIEHSMKDLRETLADVIDFSKNTERLLKNLIDVHFEFVENKDELAEIIVKEGLEQTGQEMESVIDEWGSYHELIEDVFRKGLDENPGWIIDDPEVASRLFVSWIWGFYRDQIIFDLDNDFEKYRNGIYELFVGGLKHRA